jgi:predicted cobalt transporter CbtA
VLVTPAALAVLAALAGLKRCWTVGAAVAIFYGLAALVCLVIQPSVGLPLLVCAVAAAAVTGAAWSIGRPAVAAAGAAETSEGIASESAEQEPSVASRPG